MHNHVFRDFGGINTQAKRQAIGPNEFSWLENVMPIGHGNGVVLPRRGDAFASVANGVCYYMKDYNIDGVNYMFMATDTGHAYQVMLGAPHTVTEITNTGSPELSADGLKIAQWKNERILIADPITGLWDWDGAVLTHDTATDAPPALSTIETFSGRAWGSSGRTLFFSAPDSYTDWQTASSGGSVIITDQTLHSDITQLISANNFLYFTGVDSINVIGDLQVNALGDTIFSNTNISASVGTEFALTLVPYFRSIWMGNKSGIYSLYGSTPAKASDALDGIFRLIDFTGEFSGGQVMLENILSVAFLFQYEDPIRDETRALLAIFFNKKWFVASQDQVTLIASGENDGLQNLYGTEGTALFQLFGPGQGPSEWKMQSAFWDMDDMTRTKEVNAFGFELDVGETNGQIFMTLDSLSNQQPNTDTQLFTVPVSGFVDWINDNGDTVTWQNDSLIAVQWLGSAYILNMQDTSIDGGALFGKYVGMTLQGSNVDGTISSMLMRYIWRDTW